MPPKIFLHSGPTYAEAGNTTFLPKCYVTGNPAPKVVWSKVLGQLPVGRSSTNNGSLSLLRIQKSDSGLYLCNASNLLGTQTAHTQLVVVNPPRFVNRPPPVVNATDGQHLTIRCSARGDPNPVITWRRAGGQLPAGRASVINGDLVLKRVKQSDAGIYICKVTYSHYLRGQEAQTTVYVNGRCKDTICCLFK